MTQSHGEFDLSDARGLAAAIERTLRLAGNRIADHNAESPLVTRITGHIGVSLDELVQVNQDYPPWEHASLQRGIDAYLAARAPGAEWFGISGRHRDHQSLGDLLSGAVQDGAYGLGRPDYGTAATGPDTSMEVVTLGLVAAAAPDGSPVVIGLRPNDDYQRTVVVSVFARERATAAAVRDEIGRLSAEHDVMRGQFLSFGSSEHHGNALVSFLPRPELAATDVILPDGRLEAVQAHVVGIAEHSEQLLKAGQHLKRGLLLYGPPGTGKTHTVRYLTSRLTGCTIVQLTGPAMQYLSPAVALARRLQPAVVVVEDVDLVAEDRELHDGNQPLLFALLDAMDGTAGDADVVFMLTTNRVDALERALTERPGRVDLAVEIPRPDAEGRLRLLRLYGRELRLDADLTKVADRTEGVTASFIKELVRRAVLVALRDAASVEVLTDDHFDTALGEMFDPAQSLTRGLLGAAENQG